MVYLKDIPKAPWRLEYYAQYFDLSTKVALDRVLKALWPFRSESFLQSDPEPDLYVPVWNFISLIILMTLVSNLTNDKTNITQSLISCWMGFGIYLGVNIAVAFASLRMNGGTIGLFNLVSLYGYSIVVYSPMAVLYLLPFRIFRFTILIGGAAMSLYFTERNLGSICNKHLKNNASLARIFAFFMKLILLYSIYFKIL